MSICVPPLNVPMFGCCGLPSASKTIQYDVYLRGFQEIKYAFAFCQGNYLPNNTINSGYDERKRYRKLSFYHYKLTSVNPEVTMFINYDIEVGDDMFTLTVRFNRSSNWSDYSYPVYLGDSAWQCVSNTKNSRRIKYVHLASNTITEEKIWTVENEQSITADIAAYFADAINAIPNFGNEGGTATVTIPFYGNVKEENELNWTGGLEGYGNGMYSYAGITTRNSTIGFPFPDGIQPVQEPVNWNMVFRRSIIRDLNKQTKEKKCSIALLQSDPLAIPSIYSCAAIEVIFANGVRFYCPKPEPSLVYSTITNGLVETNFNPCCQA